MTEPKDSLSRVKIDRRRFLTTTAKGGASIVVASALPSFVRADRGPNTDSFAYPFTLGVASGDPLSNAVVIWTRLAPSPFEPGAGMPQRGIAVQWELSRDENFSRIQHSGVAWAAPESGHTVHVDVRGLQPAYTYYYRFIAGGHASPVGRTRTAPAPGALVDKLRFAFASCQHYEQGYYTAYQHMCGEDLDFVVFLGDYIYEGPRATGRPRAHETDSEPTTVDGYRSRYALYRSDQHLQRAHALFPWIITWDDHEVDNNYSADIPQDPALQSRAAFLARRAAAYQVYYEHMPLRSMAQPSGPDMLLYRRLSFGRLVELNVLDTRQYRSVTEPCVKGSGPVCDALLDPARTMLGDDQEAWLLEGLDGSHARWNVLANQVPFAFTNVGQGDQVAVRQDKWDAYPVERQRIVDFIADRKPNNPIIITGDLHNAWLTLLTQTPEDPTTKPLGTEFIGTSISSAGDGTDRAANADVIFSKNPQVLFHSNRRGYVSVVVDDKTWQSAYRVVPYVSTQGAPLETRGTFVVEDGDPVAKPA